MDLNKAQIIGNLTRDPEVKTTPAGINVASFGVATNLVWTDQSGQKQEKAEFHNIVAWRKLADICGQYLKKGNKVYIEGRIQTRSWDDQTGVKRYRTEIVADNMIMLGSKNPSGAGEFSQSASAPNRGEPAPINDYSQQEPIYSRPAAPNQSNPASAPKDDEINVEDIPF